MKKVKRIQDDVRAVEKALAASNSEHYMLRLFVSGATSASVRAIKNIREICENRLQGRYELEVIDVYQHPEKLSPEQIMVTPTLVKSLPLPFRRFIGDLSDRERVLVGLDLVPQSAPRK